MIQYLSMAYRSYHCSATLLCSTCISVFLHTPLTLYVVFLLCSVHHIPSMHHSSSVHFDYYTLPPSTRINPSQQQNPSLLYSAYLYYLCTFFVLHAQCLCMLFNVPRFCSLGCSLPLQFFLYFAHSSINTLSLFYMFYSCRVLYLIIMEIPYLFWWLCPCVHHHWVLC